MPSRTTDNLFFGSKHTNRKIAIVLALLMVQKLPYYINDWKELLQDQTR